MRSLPARVWTPEQWDTINLGYRARDMDEKWNVFVEDRVAFLHRSWTGRGVLEASFAPADDNWRISAAVAESDSTPMLALSEQVNRVILELVLSAIVLGEPAAGLRAELVALLLPPDRPPPPAGLIEHSILGRRPGP